MTAGEWIALGLGGLTIVGGGGVWLGGLTWHGGRQAQKLDGVIKSVEKIESVQAEHSTAIATWPQVIQLLEEVRKDVKGLLTARAPARRHSGSGE